MECFQQVLLENYTTFPILGCTSCWHKIQKKYIFLKIHTFDDIKPTVFLLFWIEYLSKRIKNLSLCRITTNQGWKSWEKINWYFRWILKCIYLHIFPVASSCIQANIHNRQRLLLLCNMSMGCSYCSHCSLSTIKIQQLRVGNN